MKNLLFTLLALFILTSATPGLHPSNASKSFDFVPNETASTAVEIAANLFIKDYQLKDEFILEITPKLGWNKVSYYILDINKSIVGGGTLAPNHNTIILTKFPKGNYTIKLKSKNIIASKNFSIR